MRRKRRTRDEATFDLTPMIDCVFQLLIFFIVCTKFGEKERFFRPDLPLDEGDMSKPIVPREPLTLHCVWDESEKTNVYALGVGSRRRTVVPGSRSSLAELVIFPQEKNREIAAKKSLYATTQRALSYAIENHMAAAGAQVEKLEIAFARDPSRGAASGTAPWMFVSLALDACAQLNKERHKRGEAPIPIVFKRS